MNPAGGLLGRHVARRAHDRPGAGVAAVAVLQALGQAEVGDLRNPLGAQEHVRGFQVAVDHVALVGVVQRPGQRLDQAGGLLRAPRAVGQGGRHAAAIDVFEREERVPLVLADLENLHDVGMLQPGDRLGLDTETGDLLERRGPGVADHLQGDQALQTGLPGLIHDPHAAPAQFAGDLVTGRGEDRRRPSGQRDGAGRLRPRLRHGFRVANGQASGHHQRGNRRRRLRLLERFQRIGFIGVQAVHPPASCDDYGDFTPAGRVKPPRNREQPGHARHSPRNSRRNAMFTGSICSSASLVLGVSRIIGNLAKRASVTMSRNGSAPRWPLPSCS